MSRSFSRAGVPRWLAALLLLAACAREPPAATVAKTPLPSILLVTLDTTRADAMGPEAVGVDTPAFDALAARGRRFRQAYATAPETLPSHASMLTGLYPAGHGVHENGRQLSSAHRLLAEHLRAAGYRTAAFVSSFVLGRRFGLARGFDVYDEPPDGRGERSASETSDRALALLAGEERRPVFLWVHYFDPHAPYEPPEPFRTRYAGRPYQGEVAAMDAELGRLVRGFEAAVATPRAVLVAGDHGEGLGDHGEAQHGNLLYQSTMRVPLAVVGPGVAPGVSDAAVSVRAVFHTILDWAGLDAAHSLRGDAAEVVLGEAMKPFLAYGWQPQVMAVDGRHKAIRAGAVEVYDLAADPGETRNLGESVTLPRALRRALGDYPAPAPAPAPADSLRDDDRRQLASLGYVSAGAAPIVRKDAPRPVEMAHLFELLDRASGLFVREEYARVVPLLERILDADPGNLDAALRLATAHSGLGRETQALRAFDRARRIAPDSRDVRTYLALHYARGRDWQRAVPLLEEALAETPNRLPALEALARLRERQGRPADALELRQRIHALRDPSPAELARVGQLAMDLGRTPLAIASFEQARAAQGAAFAHHLELGALYLAARRLPEARAALERVPPAHPAYAMALFKRAQVSVLLDEPDQADHVRRARERADAVTGPLIEREQLFRRGTPCGTPAPATRPAARRPAAPPPAGAAARSSCAAGRRARSSGTG